MAILNQAVGDNEEIDTLDNGIVLVRPLRL